MLSKPDSRKRRRGGGVVRVGSLFEKYRKTLRAPQKSVVTTFIQVVGVVLPQALIEAHQCVYTPHTKTLAVQVRGALKTEIILHKAHILKEMRAVLGEQSTPTEII